MKEESFPVSKIKGSMTVGEEMLETYKDSSSFYKGLVNDMSIYQGDIDFSTLSPTIRDFYEKTSQYRLFAKVKWHTWFKPFSAIYRLFSRKVRQINLPLSSSEVEMTGDIIPVQEGLDGRNQPRAWVRKVDGEVCFVAIYSSHRTSGKTYMNIALPLPGATMTGVLKIEQFGEHLSLSSIKRHASQGDQGIYLSTRKGRLYKLPLHEQFIVEELHRGVLRAKHQMWIFGLPFLTIQYMIYHEDS